MPIDYDALRGPPAEAKRCRNPKCGSTNVTVLRGPSDEKPWKVRCHDCRHVSWPPKPGNENRRRDHNRDHRKRWKEILGGELVCFWCRALESEKRCEFHVDHLDQRQFAGADEFANTIPLCSDCHTVRHAMENAVRHLRGLSARAERDAA